MSDLPSTPPAKTQQSVAPTPVASGDTSPHQGTDKQLANGAAASEPAREIANAPAVTLSASVAGLREGLTINGQVANAEVNGRPTIVSENATLAVLNETSLKAGQSVVLDVIATSPGLKASLVAIDSKAPSRARELQLAVIDVSADRLAARAKVDAAIAPRSEASETALAREGTARALFLGLSNDTTATTPPLPPGSAVTVEIERVERPKPRESPAEKEAPRPSPIAAAAAEAAPSANTDRSASPSIATATAEPLLRFGVDAAEAAPVPATTTSTTASTSPATVEAQTAPATPRSPEVAAPPPTVAVATANASAARVTEVPAASAVLPQPAFSFTGIVIGTTVENRAIVETPSGLFAIDTAGQIEAGAIVTFSLAKSAATAVAPKPETVATTVNFSSGFKTTAVVTGPPVLATTKANTITPTYQPLASGTQVSVTVLGPAVPIEPVANAGAANPPVPAPVAVAETANPLTGERSIRLAQPGTTTAAASPQTPTAGAAAPQAATTQPAAAQPASRPVTEPTPAPPIPDSEAVKQNQLPPLTGLVVGHSISGQAVVQTPVGLLTVEGLEAAPKDSSIQL